MSHASSWRHSRVPRRVLLRAAASAGIGAAAIAAVGCGGDDEPASPEDETVDAEQAADQVAQAVMQAEAQAQSEPEPRREPPTAPVAGGIAALPAQTDQQNHDRWDPHRSRFTQTQLWHSFMYNRLVRWDSISDGSMEGDLTGLPEMPDEETYIFQVKPEARFWDQSPTDGRSFTADDIRFNIQRQIEGLDAQENPDLLFFRQADYTRTVSMEVTGDRTIVLRTDGPDSTYLGTVHAGPWAWMTSPEALEEFGDSWRDVPTNVDLNSGTGPYLPVSFTQGLDLLLKRSSNWWKPDTAFPEGWRFVEAPAAAADSAYLNGSVDLIDFPLSHPAALALREAFPDDNRHERPIQTAVQLGFLLSDDPDNPFADRRLARAVHLAIDRFELIDRLYFGDGRLSGPVPWYLDDWAIPEDDLLTRPGYRPDKEEDLPEIRALVDAAGGPDLLPPIPLVIPDLFQGFFPGIADTIQAMLQRNLDLPVEISFRSYQDIFDSLAAGTLPAFMGLGPVALQQAEADPTSLWLRQARTGGPENWGRYSNPDVDDRVDKMKRTFDLQERRTLALEVQEIFLEDPFWLVNVTNGIQLGISRPYFHVDERSLEFAWSGHQFDKTWLDTEHEDYPTDRSLPEDADAVGDADAAAGADGE